MALAMDLPGRTLKTTIPSGYHAIATDGTLNSIPVTARTDNAFAAMQPAELV